MTRAPEPVRPFPQPSCFPESGWRVFIPPRRFFFPRSQVSTLTVTQSPGKRPKRSETGERGKREDRNDTRFVGFVYGVRYKKPLADREYTTPVPTPVPRIAYPATQPTNQPKIPNPPPRAPVNHRPPVTSASSQRIASPQTRGGACIKLRAGRKEGREGGEIADWMAPGWLGLGLGLGLGGWLNLI